MSIPETNSPEKVAETPEASQEVIKTLLEFATELIGDADNATTMRRLADESIVVTRSANDISTKELTTPESVPPLVTIAIDRTAYSDNPTAEGKVDYEIVSAPSGMLKVIEPESTALERPEIVENLLQHSQDERTEILKQNGQKRTKEKLQARGLSQREVEDLIGDLAVSVPAFSAEESE